jgi:hypothetical protein
MAISFPTSPAVNQTYTSGSRTWSWNGTSWYLVAPSATVTVANTAPSTSVNGSLWLNSDTGDFLTYYNNGATTQWIQPVGGVGPTGVAGATGVVGPGGIVQVVSVSLNTTFTGTANGTPLAVTGLAASITPRSASNRILIISQIMYSSTGTTYGGWFTRNGTAINLGAAGSGQQQVSIGMALASDANQSNTFVYSNIDSPNATTSTTYQFYANNDNTGILYINRSVSDQANNTGKRAVSTITLLEIAT